MGPYLGILVPALLLGGAAPAPAGEPTDAPAGFYAATWNVENLFDTVDDPRRRGDNEFLPGNPATRWSPQRLETKLDNLARVIAGLNQGRGPDLLGLQEVENREVLQRLREKLARSSYGIVHADSPDPRGIDTALLFNRELFTLREARYYPVELQWGRSTRDILHAVLTERDGQRLHVFVNHWPSRGGGEDSKYDRFAAARVLAGAIREVFRLEPRARVLVLGDFNDEPASESIRTVLDAGPYPSRSGYQPDRLYNLASRKWAKGWGSFFHAYGGRTDWRMYDQIMASGALLDQAHIVPDDAVGFWVNQPEIMRQERGWNRGAPVPTFAGEDNYRGGFSDHFPVAARFTYLRPAEAPPPPPRPPPGPRAPRPFDIVVW